MGEVFLERHEWPLVIVRWPDAATTDESLEGYFRSSLTDLERAEPFCILHDSRYAKGFSATQRRNMAKYLDEHRERITEHTVAVAIVSQSPIVRGMIQAVGWIMSTPCPQRAFSNDADARQWLSKMMQQRTGKPLERKRSAS